MYVCKLLGTLNIESDINREHCCRWDDGCLRVGLIFSVCVCAAKRLQCKSWIIFGRLQMRVCSYKVLIILEVWPTKITNNIPLNLWQKFYFYYGYKIFRMLGKVMIEQKQVICLLIFFFQTAITFAPEISPQNHPLRSQIVYYYCHYSSSDVNLERSQPMLTRCLWYAPLAAHTYSHQLQR